MKKKTTKKKPKINYSDARDELREVLVKYTHCEAQGGMVNGENKDFGWPCGTCFIDFLKRIGLKSKDKAYKEHNDHVDRANEVWRAILQIKDYKIKK